MPHKCETHAEWLANNHYFCSCGHVEWAHYPISGKCSHCDCKLYNGEDRPLTEFERNHIKDVEITDAINE